MNTRDSAKAFDALMQETPYCKGENTMNRIKYAEQLYALISMCLGCAFIVFGSLSFIGILQPTSTSIVQSQRNIGIVFSVLGVAFLIAQAIFTVLASAKKKSYYELISNGIKVNGIVEKVYIAFSEGSSPEGCDFPQSRSAPNQTGDATLPLRWLPPATLL